MLELKHLKVFYGDICALSIDHDIVIEPHDRVGVIGSNGAGKTTLIKACLGMLPYEGTIQSQIKPQDMAVHMQSNGYVETLSCRTIMETILDTSLQSNQQLKELVDFFGFEPHLKKKYKQLSGGLKQRFTLIMVLMQDRPITFFDEVTTGLDFETRQALIEKILSWYEAKDACILFVTHYYEELEKLTNKLLILNQGELVDYGKTEALFKKYCGNSVITFETHLGTSLDVSGYRMILAPKGVSAISCEDKTEELEIMTQLNRLGINFKRSDRDIEILTMNAIGGKAYV